MKKTNRAGGFLCCAFFAATLCLSTFSLAHASVTPTLSLTVSANGSSAQVVVQGDPNSNAELHYGNSASSVNNLGATDSNGTLSVPISAGSYNINCGSTAYVVVSGLRSATIPWSANGVSCTGLSLSQVNVNLSLGQSTTVSATSNTGLAISSNTNPLVAGASINGNQISIVGSNYGTANIMICTTDGANLCGTIYVSVQQNSNNTGSSNISFSQNNVSLNLGQNQTVTVYGSGNYYVSSNTNPSNVSSTISGGLLSLSGLIAGNSTITVCQSSGGCGILNVSVTNNSQIQTSTSNSSQTPSISSISVSVNNTSGKLAGAGNSVNLSFNANKVITNPSVIIGSTKISPVGSGSGPYSVNYTLTGSEGSPVSVAIAFADFAGNSGNAYFLVGESLIPTAVASEPVVKKPVETLSESDAPLKAVFKSLLKLGSKGEEVRDLQNKLSELGFFFGTANGVYGSKTQSAVKAFQKAHHVKAVGYVGPSTRTLLNK